MSASVSDLRRNDRIFIDAGVKMNDSYHHAVPLTQKYCLLRAHAWDLYRVLHLPASPCSCLLSTHDNLLSGMVDICVHFISLVLWPPNSIDLNPLDLGVRVAEWLSYSAVVQEVPGSNPGGAESVGEWWNDCKYLPLWVYPMFSMRAYSLFQFVLIILLHWGEPSACI